MWVTTVREPGSIRLSVRDKGVGFSPENPERLFDAFYTTKSDGMGIGLSLKPFDHRAARRPHVGVAQ
jgi:signal transduction histidine kinase